MPECREMYSFSANAFKPFLAKHTELVEQEMLALDTKAQNFGRRLVYTRNYRNRLKMLAALLQRALFFQ